MRRFLFAITFIIFSSCPLLFAATGELPENTDRLLDLIDEEIRKTNAYAAQRFIRADSITRLIATREKGPERLEMILDLGYELEHVNSDSAVVIYRQGLQEARELDDKSMIQKFLIRNSIQLHALGLDNESLGILEALHNEGVLPENFFEYDDAGIMINCGLFDLHPKSALRSVYMRRALSFAEATIARTPASERDSLRYRLCQALVAREDNNKALLSAILNEVAETTPLDHPYYSAATKMLGDYYKSVGRTDDAIKAYAMSTVADLRNANFHCRSLIYLAQELYSAGDISRAYNYLTNALDQSLRAGSKFNQMELSDSLKPAAEDYRKLENRRFLIVGIMAVVLLIALGFILKILFSLHREKKSLRETNQRLSAAVEAKELYIGQYLNLCSTFLERLEDFSKTCRRKLTAGQHEDLLNFIKSGKTLEEQREAFYDIFDDTFIHIYPTFVSEVNNLLIPERRITVTGAAQLTPELRILAFQRLGIDDTAKVARFLGLSMNTIYTYRNKLRSRARDRETFDRDVMNIGIIF